MAQLICWLLYWWDAVPTPRGRLSPGYNSRSGSPEPIESMEGSDS